MASNAKPGKPKTSYRFGIGEWYGKSFVQLTPEERKQYAEAQFDNDAAVPPCPFLSSEDEEVRCWKKGGVCSLRSYQKGKDGAVAVDQRGSTFRVICPSRFQQAGEIYRWVGEVILGDANATPVGEMPFLERVPLVGGNEVDGAKAPREVGRIDNILVRAGSDPLDWCAIEIQAVYFSGPNMKAHFKEILDNTGAGLAFPKGTRRPDYRSSAPKRLMPQLLIKVPTLRTWGKKTAVIVDEDFFKAMGRMETVADVSNSEVAWFVVRFEEDADGVQLRRGPVIFTRLESSRDGLIAGQPPTRANFERKIRARLPEPASLPNPNSAR